MVLMMKYESWNVNNAPKVPDWLVKAPVTSLLRELLASRSTTYEECRELMANPAVLHDPFLLTDMDRASERVKLAIERKERVAVYGDYDVDGITAACMLCDYLTWRGIECDAYIPDRIEEGYGLNAAAVESLQAKGYVLIITVDCGVTALKEAELAASLGIDMVITDHHECREQLPSAYAVVDPKRPDCDYPNTGLAGVGVAFKLICAVEGAAKPIIERYADLIAVGTVADVMPMRGENRYLTKKGLRKLRDRPAEGLRALMSEAGIRAHEVSSSTLGYVISPRLNAAGRLGLADKSVRLLLTRDPREATIFARELCELNRQRQELEAEIWSMARKAIGDLNAGDPIILAGERWHQGVIGIVASRLAEAYSTTAIMISLCAGEGSLGRGSCRSYGGFNLHEALCACSDYLDGFGGHAMAAGLTIKRGNIEAFRQAFTDYYHRHPPNGASELNIDLIVEHPELLSMASVASLDDLEPYGSGNPKPVLCIKNALLRNVTPVGGGRHLKLLISKFSQQYECVFFSCTEKELSLHSGDFLDIAFFPQINEFRMRKSVQLCVIDIKPSEAVNAP